MPKGVNAKPDHLKTGEQPREMQKTTDDLSTVDKGHDYVKAGETAQVGH